MLKNWKQTYIEATNLLPKNLKEAMQNGFSDNCQVFEIRLILDNFPLVITSNGVKTINFNISGQILEQSVISLTGNSYHSYQRELAKGFIPLKNGHRAGIAGTVVYGEKNEILSIKNITAIVLRIANEVALEKNILIDDFIKNGLHSIFISGPPCSGKTTFLRDTAKKLSELDYSVVVIDERQELFIGLSKCIVIKSVSKPQGIEMAVKSLSPQILICDEISNSEESEALINALNCGVSIIASLHSGGKEEFQNKRIAKILLSTKEFKKAIFLQGQPNIGRVKEVLNLS